MGRDLSRSSRDHPGNREFRQLIARELSMYDRVPNSRSKTEMAMSIVESICAGGGRFLKKYKINGQVQVDQDGQVLWECLSYKQARQMVSNTFKDRRREARGSRSGIWGP
eukprot:CAMPEP_0116143330 /NCGR_PEP_ID=MMETSP0329-20121206/15392_1 /TAXON_ID=697910 /ORGANISM="Pseudo-nitzschia arenysensis, Strain B593" /LENGTH=109 /DNA_ID=CAMNT_0003638641 /DNA_START=88 /DNA_END=417 /DNA_ORIENTATION=-